MDTYQVCTIWHLKELASGERKLILAKDAKHINIPQFEGLKVEAMLEFAMHFPDVMRALPSEAREREKLHR